MESIKKNIDDFELKKKFGVDKYYTFDIRDLIFSTKNRINIRKILNKSDVIYSKNEIFEIITLEYQEKGYSLENIEKLDYLIQLPPRQACLIATEFSDVLASLNPETSAFIFKNLLYLENSEN